MTDGKIISFEAMKKKFDIMKKTIEINQLKNVILENLALGSEVGMIEMDNSSPTSSFVKNELVEHT